MTDDKEERRVCTMEEWYTFPGNCFGELPLAPKHTDEEYEAMDTNYGTAIALILRLKEKIFKYEARIKKLEAEIVKKDEIMIALNYWIIWLEKEVRTSDKYEINKNDSK